MLPGEMLHLALAVDSARSLALGVLACEPCGMDCPLCGSATRVIRTTTPESDRRLIVRERQCLQTPTHRFATEEHERLQIADVAVRQTGSGKITPYERAVLESDLRNALLIRRASDSAVDVLIDEILDRVEQRIMRREVPTTEVLPAERSRLLERSGRIAEADPFKAARLSGIRVLVPDSAIESAVDSELARSDKRRSQRVLYALSVRGRQGGTRTHPGWKDADYVINWLAKSFPAFEFENPPSRTRVSTVEITVPVARDLPVSVLKRDGTRMDFDFGRFRRAVFKAIKGRRDEDVKTDGIVWATLARLQGQSVITSTQPSIIGLEIMRATDEVAYLCAAVRVKGLSSVRDIWNEAISLRSHPSERLLFRVPTTQIIIPRTL